MTPGNFNWFMHTMLFYHTQHIIKKQKVRQQEQGQGEDSNSDESSDSETD